ncbi:hypothetical protein Q6280_27460, partial [Klebsiella pneumoniae]|uniref:hypothetical protein n=1 Tax=Klebsiella pneumoniae TaxID=573 RepID=UPI0027302CDB
MKNYEMVIYPVFSERRLSRLRRDLALLHESDGAVVCTMNTEFLLKNGIDFGTNIVFFEAQSEEYDCVYLDNVMGGRMS